INAVYAKGSVTRGELKAFIHLLNPVAPHITEEINALCGLTDGELIRAPWPNYDEAALVKSTVEVALQVCGKVRGRMNVPADLTREAAQDFFLAQDEVKKLIGDKSVKKLVFVPGRLVNIVV
ncbi:MAG: class I tRNA ligase family protein, partial [Clostridia bacterium]|nr:class I tRNA ligase family protein [Clostridia bacterium]